MNFTPFSNVSTVYFEQVNVSLVNVSWLLCNAEHQNVIYRNYEF